MRALVAACCVGTPEVRVDTQAMPTHTGRPPGQPCTTLVSALPPACPTGGYAA